LSIGADCGVDEGTDDGAAEGAAVGLDILSETRWRSHNTVFGTNPDESTLSIGAAEGAAEGSSEGIDEGVDEGADAGAVECTSVGQGTVSVML